MKYQYPTEAAYEPTFEFTPVDNTALSLLLKHLDTARGNLAERVASLKEANNRLEIHLRSIGACTCQTR